MNKNDLPQFAALLAGIGALYHFAVSQMLVELYWQTLNAYAFQEVQLAVAGHLKDPDVGQYVPKPADIVRRIEGSRQQHSEAAWLKLLRGIQSAGHSHDVVFDDPWIHRAVLALGGWVALCSKTTGQLNLLAPSFQSYYQRLSDQPLADYPRYLTGKYHHADQPPLFIGDAKRARAVLQGQALPLTHQQKRIT